MSPNQRKLNQIRARRLQLEQSSKPRTKDYTTIGIIMIFSILILALTIQIIYDNKTAKEIHKLDQKSHEIGRRCSPGWRPQW